MLVSRLGEEDMKLFEIVSRPPRSQAISAEDAMAWMDKHANGFLKKGKRVLRGMPSDSKSALFVDSTKASPQDPRGDKFYSLWMSNHPHFKGTPKRTQSIICTTQPEKAAGYGKVFVVVPADNAQVGFVGAHDMWLAEIDWYPIATGELVSGSIEDLVDTTEGYLKELDIKIEPNSFPSLAAGFKKVNRETNTDEFFKKMMDAAKVDNLYEFWEKVFNNTHFTFSSAGDMPTKKGELWIEGACVLIPLSSTEFYEWAEKYPKFLQHLSAEQPDKFKAEYDDGEDWEEID